MQTFWISSSTIHPPTITASAFAVWNFLASGAINNGTLAASSVFSMCWSWVYISDSTLYSSAWDSVAARWTEANRSGKMCLPRSTSDFRSEPNWIWWSPAFDQPIRSLVHRGICRGIPHRFFQKYCSWRSELFFFWVTYLTYIIFNEKSFNGWFMNSSGMLWITYHNRK